MFLLLRYWMIPDYLYWIKAAVQLNIATKRFDKKLFRSMTLSTIWDLSVTCQIPPCKLTCCCCRSWPFYSLLSGFQPMTMVSYPAFCFQPEFQRFNWKQQEDICKMQAALAHTWNDSKFVASSYTTHDHTSTIVPREHVCSGPLPIIPLGHLSRTFWESITRWSQYPAYFITM